MTEIHITADSDCWTGASTLALLSAKQAQRAIVITAGNNDMVRRIEAADICAIQCPMGKAFGALNLSRVLRRIEGDEFNVYVHSPNVRILVENALKLVGRAEPINFIAKNPDPEFPKVEVEQPGEEKTPLLDFVQVTAPRFMCPCTAQKLWETAKVMLGEEDFAKLLEENPDPAIVCQFCNTEHHYPRS